MPRSEREPDNDVDITPGVSILGVLSHLNYEPWYALAEYVDNALQNWHEQRASIVALDGRDFLEVEIEIDPDGPGRIVIFDNAGGIPRSEFGRAFRAADVPPDVTGLSEFGMGMKSASIWFARNWTVETTSIGDPNKYTVEFDMETVLATQESTIAVQAEPEAMEAHFTRITLWNLNQVPRGRTLGKIRDHMRDMYRMFLRSGELRLVVSGDRMLFREPTVLVAADFRNEESDAPTLEWTKQVELSLGNGVRVWGFAALREEGATREAGFALLRRNRVIVGSGDTPYRPNRIYGGGNSFRSQRLFGELNVEGVPVSHTKDGFQWGDLEERMLEVLREQLDAEPLPLLRQAENYRSRRINRQQARLIADATDSTARAIQAELPDALEVAETVVGSNNESEPSDAAESTVSAERVVHFSALNEDWHVTVRSISSADLARWLSYRTVRVQPGTIEVDLSLNSGHPFIARFALGDRDSYEAVLRIAVALVISETLLRDSGIEFAGAMMRNVNRILTDALSTREGR